jgi:hypothetical protein
MARRKMLPKQARLNSLQIIAIEGLEDRCLSQTRLTARSAQARWQDLTSSGHSVAHIE